MGSIFERTWTTSKGEVKTGWRVTYRVNGRIRHKQFKTRRLASIFLSRLEGVINSEKALAEAQSSPTLDALFAEWIAARESGGDGSPPLEPETAYTYRAEYRTYIGPNLGSLRVREITERELREFLNVLSRYNLRHATRKKVFGTVRSILNHGVQTEEIASNPAARVRMKLDGRDARPVEPLSKDDMRKVVRYCCDRALPKGGAPNDSWVRKTALLHVLIYSGLRLSEARGLRRQDIDSGDASLKVRQKADRRGRIGRPKSRRSYRVVRVPQIVVEWLHRTGQSHSWDLIFASRHGTPMDVSLIVRHWWRPMLRRLGLPLVKIHTLRHYYASRMIELGANAKQLSQDMGHHSEAFTFSVYGHLFKDADVERKDRELKEKSVL
jgi:integrase